MIDLVLILFLAALVGGAAWYVVKAKKRGVKCIGCPSAGSCPHKSGGTDGCGCSAQTE